VSRDFLDPNGHPVFRSGIAVNPEMRPIGLKDRTLVSNLQVAGTILAGGDYLHELSMDGVDLASAFVIARG
jgi:hypothetical protein